MKRQEDKITGSSVRIRLKTSDRELIERAARQDGRGEISDWCRRVLVPAARKALGEDRSTREMCWDGTPHERSPFPGCESRCGRCGYDLGVVD